MMRRAALALSMALALAGAGFDIAIHPLVSGTGTAGTSGDCSYRERLESERLQVARSMGEPAEQSHRSAVA